MLALSALAPGALADAPAPVIDNGRVTVRSVMLSKGEPGSAITHAGDYVVLYINGGRIKGADGKITDHAAGSAMAGHGGMTSDTALDGDAHEVVVELKNSPSNTVPNTTGLPPGFPRPRAPKRCSRTTRSTSGTTLGCRASPRPCTSTIPRSWWSIWAMATSPPPRRTARRPITHHNPGDIVFNLANRSHSEELVQGDMSGVMLELK